MKSKKYLCLIALCIGVATIFIHVAFDIWLPNVSETIGKFRWVFVGVGAGLIGAAASTAFSKKMYKDNPELARQAKINENDERYIQVRKTAAYQKWFVTAFILSAMSLTFVILDLVIAAWIALSALMIHIVLYIILLFRINKTM